MTRDLIVREEFEEGTLIETAAHPAYDTDGTDHAYYVPDEARKRIAMEEISQQNTQAEFHLDDGTIDWDAITASISPQEIVERVEAQLLNSQDGDVGRERKQLQFHSVSGRGADSEEPIPTGVVKFADPDSESSASRDPIVRGYCWGTLQDQMLAAQALQYLPYQNDVAESSTRSARVPMSVVKEGNGAMIAYLVAHDHFSTKMGHLLGLEPETIQNYVDKIVDQE